jgi:hypothetical protein
MSESKLSLTFKAGVGFDAPWIVAYPDSVDEGIALANEIAAKGLDAAVANAAVELQAKYVVAKGGLGPQQVSSQPQQPVATYSSSVPAQSIPSPTQPNAAPGVIQFPQQQQAAPAQGPSCEHGAYVWKDFVSKAGNNVKGFFCPANFRTQCKPDFRK